MKHLSSGIAVVLCAAFAMTGASPAQDEDLPPLEDEVVVAEDGASGTKFTLTTRYRFDFGGDIKDGGDFDVHRFDAGLNVRFRLDRQSEFAISTDYRLSNFDFAGVSDLGDDPWDDIHEITIAGVYSYEPTDDWTVFGGPIFKLGFEGGADIDESFTFGGAVGATVDLGNAFVGFGLGVMDQIEDDVRVFPILILNWELASDLRLSSAGGVGAGGVPGLELIWMPAPKWELAGGIGYEYRRFRLDNGGIAPHGVGEEQSIPTWFRVGYKLNETVSVSVFAGVLFNGKFELQDTGGNHIEEVDYDPTGFIGIGGSFRF